MSRVVGIDLGTTNSCVAVLDGDQVVVIPNAEGSRTTPSYVGFPQNGDRLVGQVAKRQAVTNPLDTIYAVKRLMGRKFEDPNVARHLSATAYLGVAAENGDVRVKARGREYSPPEVSAIILGQMKKIAEDYLGDTVSEAVITVPAYFDDAQRQATKDAGRIAGLEVLRIVNEPTAAALAYGAGEQRNERVAVYDLGGGTFDISVLELQGGVFQVRGTAGDTFLGGEDFDRLIVDWLADGFQSEHGIDLRADRMALQRLKEGAEKAKLELSSAYDTDVTLPFICADATGPKHLARKISRAQLEELVEPLIERTLGPCRQVLVDVGMTVEDIDEVILVGGQTRMPMVQEMVARLFGRTPNRSVNPDEVVAVGAAIQAGVLCGLVQEVLLLDVTPLSIGVETAGGVFTRLIARNTTIPARMSEIFSTAADNQSFVNVHVLQGERDMAADNRSLAQFELIGIPPAPRGIPKIEVTFEIDANGILEVAAKDLGTGRMQTVHIVSTSGLDEREIGRLVDEAGATAQGDATRRELAELKNQAEALIYSSERALTEFGGALAEQERVALEQDLGECKNLLEFGSVEQLQAAILRLEASAQRIGELIYAQAAGDSEGVS
ncbi:MAG: molecular chaperone DnaK [Myxococcales bacterium]|nr:molecular chaperone DnaK [Myxococcales bacterium]